MDKVIERFKNRFRGKKISTTSKKKSHIYQLDPEKTSFGRFFYWIFTRYKFLSTWLKRKKAERLTIMFIPHNEQSIRNFHISNLTLTILITGISLVVIISSLMIINHNSTVQEVDKLKVSQKGAKIQFSKIREEIMEIERSFGKVKDDIDILHSIRLGEKKSIFDQNKNLNMNQFLKNEKESVDEIPIELYLLNRIQEDMKRANISISGMKDFISRREKIIKNTPSIWPVEGHIANPYGYIRNAQTLTTSENSSVEIVSFPGAKVRASAPGVVVFIERNSVWQWSVKIRHNYSYETIYRGLGRAVVESNEKVVKGETIGFLGRPSYSLESILHYEIHVGVDSVDPLPYLGYVAK